MGHDSGGGDMFADAGDDSQVEPEIDRWLKMFAEATDGRRDAVVATICNEMNRLLRQYRKADSVHREDRIPSVKM